MSGTKRTDVYEKKSILTWLLVCLLNLTINTGIRADWYMAGADRQRTSHVSDEVQGNASTDWYVVLDPYVDSGSQVIAANGKIFVSTARGLYCFDAVTGQRLWTFATELPLGHSPTYDNGTVYVGCMDRRIYAIDEVAGTLKTGWTFYEAGAGYATNPLVINNTVYAGNRDGHLYALNTADGTLKWMYPAAGQPALGPINFSPAIDSAGIVYFASDDSYAYAVNGNTGALVWKSDKLPGTGFQVYWPVIYDDKASGKGYVLLSGSRKASCSGWWGGSDYQKTNDHQDTLEMYEGITCPALCGPTGTEPYPNGWVTGTQTIAATLITEYFEANADNNPPNFAMKKHEPWVRVLFVLDRSNGKEFTFDSDGDGFAEYAPFNSSGITAGGNHYPPIIGSDGVIYSYNGLQSGWLNGGSGCMGNSGAGGYFTGWKFGTKYISRISTDFGSSDEPMSYTSGGGIIYWSEGFNSGVHGGLWGSVEYTKPIGTNAHQYYGITTDSSKYNATDLNGVFGTNNGVYSYFDGRTCQSLVPYNNRLYQVSANCLNALKVGGAGTKLSMAPKQTQTVSAAVPLTKSYIQQRLESEIRKMISAGHLRPGFINTGSFGVSSIANSDSTWRFSAGDNNQDYFHNPFDTITTLLTALPHLSGQLQADTSAYIKNEYNCVGWFDGHKAYEVAHIGWKNGAQREAYIDTPEMTAELLNPYQYSSVINTPITQNQRLEGQATLPWKFPQDSFYGAWKYAQQFPSEAKTIFDNMKDKLEPTVSSPQFPSNTTFIEYPYFLNPYIAGYRGYMELEKMVNGYTSITQSSKYAEYQRLLALRLDNFSKDSPFTSTNFSVRGSYYYKTLNVARNFMFMTQELADEMSASKLSQVQTAMDEYNEIAPFWFQTNYNRTVGEANYAPLYDYQALFQAKAMIQKQSYDELVKYIDVPAFERGDLFYIRNLVLLLEATGGNQPSITVNSPNGGEVWNTGSQATVSWASANITGNVNIDITTDGSTWTSLAANAANDGSEQVMMPSAQSTTCKVRVQSVSGTPSDTSDGNFTLSVPVPSITVISPNGGESWQTGTNQTVTWTSANISGNVDIEVSLGGINGPWATLVPNTSCDGSEVVTLPLTPTLSGRIRVKSVSGTPSDYSNSDFTLTTTPQPIVSVNPSSIDFGSITQGQTVTNTFNITNTGAGTLSGTLTASQPWLTATPATFSGNSAAVTVSVNTTGLAEGANTGAITVATNGGTATVNIIVNVILIAAYPQLNVSSSSLSFGELAVGLVSEPQVLTIKNDGTGMLTGTITVSDSWITIDKTSLNLAAQAEEQVTVNVDNSVLDQKEGPAKGEITITSNGNNGAQVTTTISVEFTATCVLVKPNPVRLSSPLVGEGKGEGSITFFGDGIVPGQTTIKIYTLSGELVNILNPQSEICNTQSPQAPGIYIYVYESPKERGVAKFTVTK